MRLEMLANSIENAKKAPISIVEGRYLLPRAGAAVIIFPAGAYIRFSASDTLGDDRVRMKQPLRNLSNGVQKGPPIGVEEGPPLRIC